MKRKLRKIVVLERGFLWNFRDKLLTEKVNNEFISRSILTVFPFENKKAKITVVFDTWNNLYTGNPLKQGKLNLNSPSVVSKIIEYLITNNIWLTEEKKPISIEGLEILSKIGYEIEFLKPNKIEA